MAASNEIILIAGVLSILAVYAAFASTRIGTPLMLGLIRVGILAGSDGLGGIRFENFRLAYLVGSRALAVILFQGGVSTKRSMFRRAFWPSVTLATLGVAVSTVIIGALAVTLYGVPLTQGLLLGATTAPTDAAVVSTLLRFSDLTIPARWEPPSRSSRVSTIR